MASTTPDQPSSVAAVGSAPHGSVSVTVRVLNGRNLRGTKGEKSSTLVRVQLADFDIKDSAVVPETSSPEYNHIWQHDFDLDEHFLDIFSTGKVSFTVIESLPKEKTAVLGTGELMLSNKFLRVPNLLEAAKGATNEVAQTTPAVGSTTTPSSESKAQSQPSEPAVLSLREAVSIAAAAPSDVKKPAVSMAADDLNRPMLDVEVTLSRPLLTAEDRQAGMFVNIKPDDLAPTPDEWTLREPSEKDMTSNLFQYTLSVSLPTTADHDRVIKIPNGVLVGEEERVPTPQPPASPDAPPSMNNLKKRVQWTNSVTTWMYKEGLERLKAKVMAKEPLDVELTREFLPRFSHLTDPSSSKHRARGALEVSTLILPRVSIARVRCSLEQPADLEASKGGTAKKTEQKPEDPFGKVGATVGVELRLERELVERKKLMPITKSVRDFIKPRANLTAETYAKRAQKAEADYRDKVRDVARRLVKEWRDTMGVGALRQVADGIETDMEKSKKNFLFHINSSGVYFQLKESLKPAITHLVRERFRQRTPLPSSSDLQLFLSDLYVHLISEMHAALQSMFRDPAVHAVDGLQARREEYGVLGRFADECEADGDMSAARHYHLERVARWEGSEQAWYEYGCFEIRRGEVETGVECLKEVLAGLPGSRGGKDTGKHIPSLLAYGATCTANNQFEEARVMLETAHNLEPRYSLSAMLLGLYFDVVEMDEESDRWLAKAGDLWATERATAAAKGERAKVSSVFIDAAEFLLHCRATQLAERALALELLAKKVPVNVTYWLQARLQVQRGDFGSATQQVLKALEYRQDNVDAWAEWGHLLFMQKMWKLAREKYEALLGLEADPEDPYLVYLRLGTIYLLHAYGSEKRTNQLPTKGLQPETLSLGVNQEFATLARTMFLRACEHSSTSRAWLGVGRACLALGRWDEAEEALCEGNALNNRDGKVWCWLALLCVERGRLWEGKQAWGMAARLGVKEDADGLRLLGNAFLRAEEYILAADAFRMYLGQEGHEGDEEVRQMFKVAVEAESDKRQPFEG